MFSGVISIIIIFAVSDFSYNFIPKLFVKIFMWVLLNLLKYSSLLAIIFFIFAEIQGFDCRDSYMYLDLAF